METKLKVGEIQKETEELIVLGLYEDQTGLSKSAGAVEQVLGGLIAQMIGDGDFKGKSKELGLLYSSGRETAKRILSVGLGKEGRFDVEAIRVAAGTAARRACELGVKKFSSEVLGADLPKVSLAESVQAAEGRTMAILGLGRNGTAVAEMARAWNARAGDGFARQP